MKKLFILLLSVSAFFKGYPQKYSSLDKEKNGQHKGKTVYDFKVEALLGGIIDFSNFKGKKILIVNTASKCGFTSQYADPEKLYNLYKDRLVVVGFPANDFGGQEPDSNIQIGAFCRKNYGVKISVKGKEMAPLYRYLTSKELNGVKDCNVLWNFTKFLLDENGKLVDCFDSAMNPLSTKIMDKIMIKDRKI